MSGRLAAGLAALLIGCADVLITIVTRDPWTSNDGLTLLVLGAMATVALIVLRRQPRNAVAWLLLMTALLGLADAFDRAYLVLDYRLHAGRLPFGAVAADYRGGITILPFLVGLPAILLFPEGRVPSRRWRRALWIYVVLGGFFTVTQFVGQALVGVPHHLAVDVRGSLPKQDPGAIGNLAWFLTPLFLAFWLASVGHQVGAWRRSQGEQQAQLKWLMSGAALCVVSSVALVMAGDGLSLPSRLITDAAVLGIGSLPIAIGIGILKYRLYEIDRLVSRTISYAIVTGTLVAFFLGVVVLATDVLPISSPVGVAASTLAAAALFNPLRRRVQRVVDRRFNRARYDAEATLDAFARRLREAVELESVQRGLADTVANAFEPTHVTVWVKRAG